ncbi:PIN domain-containing protein [Arthrobacter antibioticus]|uniref:PIN domain-containing protein n=1 Tax=Arthrobacter sp. H35-MC1 TaxID=3046203 RepID=UPI0024BB36DC|nr:PIN domain-containing protein [Arthrobacter sp. H35-MC1]MDJ0318595.1 PIN domain-containing protein [Arthrobacter sp. H35-MC1]
MIAIVLDTNILRKSPYLSRNEWVLCATHKDEWKVRILVPEVVVMETTNTVTRDWTTDRNACSRVKVGGFGLQKEVDTIVQAIDTHITSYEDDLKKRLSELGAEILPDPAVSHTEVAKRAAKRTAPYQDKSSKDNYRDTIIWLSVIEAAGNNPEHEVWFVSENHDDFGIKGNSTTDEVQKEFHQGLHKELVSLGLQDRVKYAQNLADLVQHISSIYGPIDTEELNVLTAAVQYDELRRWLDEKVLAMTIAARDIALDPTVSIAVVSEILSPALEWKFSDEAKNGETEWTAKYVVDFQAVVLGYSIHAEESRSTDNKVLRASGTVTFGKQGSVQKFEIAKLEALPDDPNRWMWELLDQTGFPELGDFGPALADRLRNGFTTPTGTMEALRRLAQQASGATLPPGTMDAIETIHKALDVAEGSGELDEETPPEEDSGEDPSP